MGRTEYFVFWALPQTPEGMRAAPLHPGMILVLCTEYFPYHSSGWPVLPTTERQS